MKALVTGGAGFIGSHIVDKLVELKHDVAILDSLRTGKQENINPDAKFFRGDIRDLQFLKTTFNEFGPEVIFHLAAQNSVPVSMENPYIDQDMNIVGMIKLMDIAKQVGVKKVIYSNTGGALYGDVEDKYLPIKEDQIITSPTSFYGVSKGCAESYLNLYSNLYNIPWVSLRYSNVYGPRQVGSKEAGVIALFINQLLSNEQPIINGDGKHTRDYVYVGDVVEANIKALAYKNSGSEGPYFNISTGTETSNQQVFDLITKITGSNITPKYGPDRPGDPRRNSLSPEKAKLLLDWEPKVDLLAGVQLTIKYYSK